MKRHCASDTSPTRSYESLSAAVQSVSARISRLAEHEVGFLLGGWLLQRAERTHLIDRKRGRAAGRARRRRRLDACAAIPAPGPRSRAGCVAAMGIKLGNLTYDSVMGVDAP